VGMSIWTSSDATTWTAGDVESAGCETPDEFCSWSVSGIERLGDQLIATGHQRFNSSDGTALISWLSDDGMTWTLATDDLQTTAQSPVTAESNGTVLVVTPVLTGPEGISVFNTSEDGQVWESSSESDGFRLYGVYGDEDGFVAAGTFIEDAVASSGMVQPVVRTSSDGHTWRTAAIGTAGGDILSEVARLPSGRYVAAGVGADGMIVAWASNGNDEPWTVSRLGTAHDPEGFAEGHVVLADGPDGVVLAWNTGDGLSIATTINGEDWTLTDAPRDAASIVFSALEIAGDTAVAFGGPRNPENGFVPGVPFRGWIGSVALRTD
jgi:WD40 repeat protein